MIFNTHQNFAESSSELRYKYIYLILYILFYAMFIFFGALGFHVIEYPNEKKENLRLHAYMLTFLKFHSCITSNSCVDN